MGHHGDKDEVGILVSVQRERGNYTAMSWTISVMHIRVIKTELLRTTVNGEGGGEVSREG